MHSYTSLYAAMHPNAPIIISIPMLRFGLVPGLAIGCITSIHGALRKENHNIINGYY
jgi:hypothetical protein